MNAILIDIYRNTKIAPYLAFKGGTACMYFHGLKRFSTDLDFDLLDGGDIDVVKKEISSLLLRHGTMKDQYVRENTLFFLLSYGALDMNLKIEISRRNYPNEYEVVNWRGFSLKIMKKPYVLAHKMVALTDRGRLANRDVFDIYFFLSQGWEWSEDIIRLRTGMSGREYIKKMIHFLETKRNVNLLENLGEVLLDNKQKHFVKYKLLDELLLILRKYE